MKKAVKIKASVLGTVIVVSVLMLLAVLGMVLIWESDFILFSRTRYVRLQQDNVNSVVTLYRAYPGIVDNLPADGLFRLYGGTPPVEMYLSRDSWGMYETLQISSACGKVNKTRLLGLDAPMDENPCLWYRNDNSSLTLTGRTILEGPVMVPDDGVVYGRLQVVYFSGIRLEPEQICTSSPEMPGPAEGVEELLEGIFAHKGELLPGDTLANSFTSPTLVVHLGDTVDVRGHYSGNVILTGGSVRVDSTARLENVIVTADKIIVGDGFEGSAQLFARDSVLVGARARLRYPSGCYSRAYGHMADSSEISGYFIVDSKLGKDLTSPNFIKSRSSLLRGLLYVAGTAQVQGIITGSAVLDESVIYTQDGFYRGLLLDLTILENGEIAYPLWLDIGGRRKEAVWLK